MVQHVSGEKINQTKWATNVEEAIRGEAAQARKVAMLSSKSRKDHKKATERLKKHCQGVSREAHKMAVKLRINIKPIS